MSAISLAIGIFLRGFVTSDGGKANIARAAVAMAGAPQSVAGIPSRSGPVAVLGLANEPPTMYAYNRFWISGNGLNNGGGQTTNQRLQNVAFIYNFANWRKVFNGGVTNNMSDGSSADYWNAGKEYAGSPPMIGLQTNSRYLTLPTGANGQASLVVDGLQVAPGVQYTTNNQSATWDFGTNAERKIVIKGGFDTWISEVLIEAGATIAPYDFTRDFPVTVSGIGDSYWGSHDFTGSGLTFADMKYRQLGGFGITATHRGGTGYYNDSGEGEEWRGRSASRIARFTEAKPTIMSVELGINDPWPANTPGAMLTALQGYRAGNPDGIMVVLGPWAPNQSNGTNPAGAYIAKMDQIIATMATIPGPWVVLDNLRGNWITSNGKTRAVLRGPWQTGDGYIGSPTGTGNGDTWVNADQTHPSTPVGIRGLAQIWGAEARAAIGALAGNLPDLLAAMFAEAGPGIRPPGYALDFSDLTEEKLAWRKNMLFETEFRNGLADQGGSGVTTSTIAGFAGAIAFGTAGVTAYSYKTANYVGGQLYNMSVFVKMDDGGAPVFGSGIATDAVNDFALVTKGDAVAPNQFFIEPLAGGVYRVSTPYTPANNTGTNTGVVKYSSNSARTFKVTGYQLTKGPLQPYQALTDGYTEFLAAFPRHLLFRENTGQTAVMSLEDPIGLALDARFNGERSAPLPDPGSNNPATVYLDGQMVFTNAATAWGFTRLNGLTVGSWYEFTYEVVSVSGGSVRAYSGTSGIGSTRSAPGKYREIIQCAGNGTESFIAIGSSVTAVVKDFKCREVYGNHAIQATPGDRPAVSAKVNQLLNTALLGGGALPTGYNQFGATGLSAPNGSVGGDVVYRHTAVAQRPYFSQNGGQALGVSGSQTFSYYVGAIYSGGTIVSEAIRALGPANSTVTYAIDGTAVSSAAVLPPNCILSTTITSGGTAGVPTFRFGAGCGTDATIDFDISRPMVSIGDYSQRGRYQRVNTATDYDYVGFPMGARFNGINTKMQIPSLDMSASDKAMMFASIRKDSDATAGIIFETTADANSNNGAMGLYAPHTNNVASLAMIARGTVAGGSVSATGFPAPVTAVMNGRADIGASTRTIRANGVDASTSLTAIGTGNFAVAPGNIGSRASGIFPFPGVIYRLGTRGGAYDLPAIQAADQWANERVKAYA